MSGVVSLTPEQRLAVEADGCDVLVRAGAGSGKTRVLVERYIRLLCSGCDLDDLVAITFTEKAAREMRDRVRRVLEVLRREEPHIHRWQDLYLRLADARIGTIHAFCARLLREYAAEAGLDPDFEILDEIDSDVVLDEVVEQVLVAFGAENQEGAYILFDVYDPYQVQKTLRLLLRESADGLEHFSVVSGDTLVLVDWDSQHDYTKLKSKLQHFREHGPRGDKLHDKLCTLIQHLEEAENARAENDLDALITALDACITLKFGRAGRQDAWRQAQLDKKEVAETMQKAQEIAQEMQQQLLAAQEERLLYAWKSLLCQAKSAFVDEKRARSMLDFDDLEAEAVKLLENSAVADDVRSHITHILVDEFQDTNRRQLALVQALRGAPNQGRLFVVGDAQQSIYAFRNADVRAFLALADEIKAHGGHMIELARSFRAHQALVKRLNAIFAPLFDNANPEQVAFQPLEADRATPPQAPTPFVRCIAFSKPSKGSIMDVRKAEAAFIAETIQQIVANQWPVGREQRPATYGDIALLFRATSDIMLYEDALKAANIPFVTIAGRGFFDRREVRDLLSLLRAVEDPHDDFALLAALRSPIFGLSDAALVHLRLSPHGEPRQVFTVLTDAATFHATLQRLTPPDDAHLHHARRVLLHLRHLSGRVSLFELLREALDATDYLATLTLLPDGKRRRSNVEKLLAFIRQRRLTSLRRFNRTIEELSTRDVREGEAVLEAEDAVRLMTIHAAKGLEFPIVFLADAGRRVYAGQRPFVISDEETTGAAWPNPLTGKRIKGPRYTRIEERLQQRDEAENIRLLYVALTRAEDYVFISGMQHSGWIKMIWDYLDENEKQVVSIEA